jgi:Tfp pilus tip-associated adhesin PilY1
MLSESTVFQGAIYFTTYTPGSTTNPCEQGGRAKFYAIDYLTGAGLFTGGVRSSNIGIGIPSAPIVSIGPTGIISVYASTSQSGVPGGPATGNVAPPGGKMTCPVDPCPPRPPPPGCVGAGCTGGPQGWIYYWRDNRLQ